MVEKTDLELLQILSEKEAGLTGWEIDRLDEWFPLVESGIRLTEKQRNVLKRAIERIESD